MTKKKKRGRGESRVRKVCVLQVANVRWCETWRMFIAVTHESQDTRKDAAKFSRLQI